VTTTTAAQSLWLHTAPDTAYPALTGDLDVDVAVIGGGIAGLTTALMLKREGARVAVLEALRVGTGVTGNTSAKVSALQATVYTQIRSAHDSEAAAIYATASRAAVEEIAVLAADEGIECDLERRTAFTYAATEDERDSVEQEAEAAAEAGLPAQLVDDTDLPYDTFGAVRLDDQLQFHPVKYCQGLAAAVDGGGSAVHEQTRVTSVSDGSPCTLETEGGTVTAQQVVVATHYPLLDRAAYFARLEAKRSYCVAARLGATPPQGMSISAGQPTRSLRAYGDLLVVGGEGHTAGSGEATPERYERLEQFARDHFDVRELTHRWSAQDPVPYDHLPVIGRYHPRTSRLFVTSGYMKWGLTSATFGALILRDLINGRENVWAARFDPNRLTLGRTPKIAQLGAKFSADFVGDRITPAEASSVDAVPPGEGRVVRDGVGKIGVFRDDDGAVHAVSLRCTHLGCLLRYNGAERSWDCPCHGSRFDVDGNVLEGPAVSPLESLADRYLER
jgi:glycine/D-amino acid oxidase-like deaminating enzyme/nitrite reductase/ring-hydroxylating ferredoxin subunit